MKKLTVAAPLLAALAFAAPPAGASPMHVAGIQSPPDKTAGQPGDPCRALDPRTGLAPALVNKMAGGLVGCWYTDIFDVVRSDPNGGILAVGTEHFIGCVDADRNRTCNARDPRGTLAFVYAFEGRFDKSGNELRGQCQHPILSGTRDFAGARGQLNFKDDVTTGTAAYRGHITLAKRPGHAPATASAARTSRSIC
jgi:hypothetical protein